MAASPETHPLAASDAQEAGRYFRYMAEFVGFTEDDSKAIRQSALIIEKHLPGIIGKFYTNLLQYPPTRRLLLKKDGALDEAYLQLRMLHQANFWRRTAGGVYDDDYAAYIDYVGRAHTSRGADPHIDIAERYVIGMVGFVQHAIIDALMRELHDYDPQLEQSAIKAWNKLCMVILEMLARAYGEEHVGEVLGETLAVDAQSVFQMSVDSYEKGLGLLRPSTYIELRVASIDEILDGERKLVELNRISIGIFHHKGGWYAIRNYCLHRGGPVATGLLAGDQVVCPWHGYTYNLTDGRLVTDPSARLEMYPVSVRDGGVYLRLKNPEPDAAERVSSPAAASQAGPLPELKENAFLLGDLRPGQVKRLTLAGRKIAVYNVEGV
jgi:nitrite reductase (NADH) small subunit